MPSDSHIISSSSQRDLPIMMNVNKLQELLGELCLLLNIGSPIQTRDGGERNRSTVQKDVENLEGWVIQSVFVFAL